MSLVADPHPSNDNDVFTFQATAQSTYGDRARGLDFIVRHGDGGGEGGSETRLERLELAIAELRGQIDGMKHSQNITVGAVLGTAAILFAAIVYVAAAVNSLPAQLTDLATSISGGITAARSVDERAPIIINVPPLGSGTSGVSPSPQQLHQPSAPRPSPSDDSSETPAPANSD